MRSQAGQTQVQYAQEHDEQYEQYEHDEHGEQYETADVPGTEPPVNSVLRPVSSLCKVASNGDPLQAMQTQTQSSDKPTELLQLQVIDTAGGFSDLRELWNDLLSQSRQNTLFLSWEWLYTWWENFGQDAVAEHQQDTAQGLSALASKPRHQLQILLLHDGSSTAPDAASIVAIAPFQLINRPYGTGQVLTFLGNGEPEHCQVVSEYLDVICKSGYEDAAAESISQWLIETRHWSKLEFQDLARSALILSIAERIKQQFHGEVTPGQWSYHVPISASVTFLDRLSASRRKRLMRSARAIESDGGMQVQRLDNPALIPEHYRTLQRLHNERWQQQGKQGTFESPKFNRFHQRLLSRLVPLGLADIAIYRINDKPVAALYCLFSPRVAYYYQSGFSAANANRYMPLANAHRLEMQRQVEKGKTTYDFMRGGAQSYKREFGCDATQLFDVSIHRLQTRRWASTLRHAGRKAASQTLRLLGLRN